MKEKTIKITENQWKSLQRSIEHLEDEIQTLKQNQKLLVSSWQDNIEKAPVLFNNKYVHTLGLECHNRVQTVITYIDGNDIYIYDLNIHIKCPEVIKQAEDYIIIKDLDNNNHYYFDKTHPNIMRIHSSIIMNDKETELVTVSFKGTTITFNSTGN